MQAFLSTESCVSGSVYKRVSDVKKILIHKILYLKWENRMAIRGDEEAIIKKKKQWEDRMAIRGEEEAIRKERKKNEKKTEQKKSLENIRYIWTQEKVGLYVQYL